MPMVGNILKITTPKAWCIDHCDRGLIYFINAGNIDSFIHTKLNCLVSKWRNFGLFIIILTLLDAFRKPECVLRNLGKHGATEMSPGRNAVSFPDCCTLLCFECVFMYWILFRPGSLGRWGLIGRIWVADMEDIRGYARLWVSLVEIDERSEHAALGGILRCAHLTSIFFTVNWHMWGPYWCAHPSQPPKIQTRRTPWFQASQGYIVNPVSKLNP